MRKSLVILFTTMLVTAGTAFSASNYNYEPTQVAPVHNSQYQQMPLKYTKNNTLQGNVVMVPAGTDINARLTSPLSSEYASVGQTVNLALNEDFYYNGKMVAPAGSTVYGTVIEASKAKRGSINGKLCVRFTQIYTPYGTQIPISAVIRTNDSPAPLLLPPLRPDTLRPSPGPLLPLRLCACLSQP